MDEGNSHEMTINEALTGNIEFDISHAGGEFQDQLKHEMGKARCVDFISLFFTQRSLRRTGQRIPGHAQMRPFDVSWDSEAK